MKVSLCFYVALVGRAAAAASTYLSAADTWTISYLIEPEHGCSSGLTVEARTAADASKIIKELTDDGTACAVTTTIEINQRSSYDGMVVGASGVRTEVIAVGPITSSSVFGVALKGFEPRWTAKVQVLGNFTAPKCFFTYEYAFKVGLDTQIASTTSPANLSGWTPLEHAVEGKTGEPFLIVPSSLNGPFQLTRNLEGKETCDIVQTAAKITFKAKFQKPTDALAEKSSWSIGYTIFPYCGVLDERQVDDPKAAHQIVEQLKKDNPDCAVAVVATFYQRRVHHGFVYDTKGSTTAGAIVMKELLDTRLSAVVPGAQWEVTEVSILGSSVVNNSACFGGDLMYKAGDDSTMPTKSAPADFTKWTGGKSAFQTRTEAFGVKPIVDALQGANYAELSFRRAGLVTVQKDKDLYLGLRQPEGRVCQWQQYGFSVVVEARFGPKRDYLSSKDEWNLTYSSELSASRCVGVKVAECSYTGAEVKKVASCVTQAQAINPDCEVLVRARLTQENGHDGIVYADVDSRTFGIAIGKDTTLKAFTSPLANNPVLRLEDIHFTGTTSHESCLVNWQDRFVFKNDLDSSIASPEHPANFSTWTPTFRDQISGLISVRLDPTKGFQLAIKQNSTLECQVRQQKFELDFVVSFSSGENNFVTARNSWRIFYGFSGLTGCASDECSYSGLYHPILFTKEQLTACVKNLISTHPDCTGRVLVYADQENRAYGGAHIKSESLGTTGAFSIGEKSFTLIKSAVAPFKIVRSAIHFGGTFYDHQRCPLQGTKLVKFPGAVAKILDLPLGYNMTGFNFTNILENNFRIESDLMDTLMYDVTIAIEPVHSNCEWSLTKPVLGFGSDIIKFATISV